MNDGGKAFPSFERLTMLRRTDITPEQKETIYFESQGMTLRDYFAAKIMASIILSPDKEEWPFEIDPSNDSENESYLERGARCAYMIADRMLEARKEYE